MRGGQGKDVNELGWQKGWDCLQSDVLSKIKSEY